MRAALAALGLAAIAAGGCKGDTESGGDVSAPAADFRPEPIGEVEAERGQKACADYVAAVCARAEGDPSLAGECELARARPQALEMNLRMARAAGDVEARDLAAIIAEVRKISAACIEDLAKIGGPLEAPEPPAE